MKPLYFALVFIIVLTPAQAQNWRKQSQAIDCSPRHNLGANFETAFLGFLSATNAGRVRVHFVNPVLRRSKLQIRGLQDGQMQILDSAGLAMWNFTSAMFNGEKVALELLLAPGDEDVTVDVDYLLADVGGRIVDAGYPTLVSPSLCGPDSRVGSTDNRVGRIAGGCTGWLVANGAVLTAGHCNIAAGDILEVNIPASQPNGTTVASAVQDQFPVLAGSVTTVNNMTGDDWSVCRIGNNYLGQSAHVLHGFFRMTRELPSAGQLVRVTGCGTDNTPLGTTGGNNAQNQTLQTATGSFSGQSGSEPRISLLYPVDTTAGNSGSPIIWEANGFAIGIHTTGVCIGSGYNEGTSFELNALENAIAAVTGPNTRYLDTVKAPSGTEDGTVFQPHDSLVEVINAVPSGGIICIVRGNFTGANNRGTFNKPATLIAPVGGVTLGQ